MRSMTLRSSKASNELEPRRSSRLNANSSATTTKSKALKLVKAQEKQSKLAKVKRAPLARKSKPSNRKASTKSKTPKKITAKTTAKTTIQTTTKAGHQECSICAETKPLGRGNANFPQFSNCRHPANTCSTCITKHLTIYVGRSNILVYDQNTNTHTIDWTRYSCMGCDQSFPENEIRSLLSRKQIQSIDSAIEKKAQVADANWSWCTSAECSARQKVSAAVIYKKEKPIVICRACGAKSCFYHGVPWHEGYTCVRYDDEHPNAESVRSSEERIKRISKQCPTKGCLWRIQKSGGCPNVFCIGCHQYLDWNKVQWDLGVTPEPEMAP